MRQIVLAMVVIAVISLAAGVYNRQTCQVDPGPRAAVLAYLSAMKEQRFENAYDYVTSTMTDGKPRDAWAGLQRKMFQLGGVTLGELDVRTAKRTLTGLFKCADVATVPNVLKASDVLNNQGSTEFEIYKVVKQDGLWRVDAQETLFEEPAIRQWFPNDPIPEFNDTAPVGP